MKPKIKITSGRKVRFTEENETHQYDDEDYDHEDIWFSGEDYVKIKATSKAECKEWRRRGYGLLLKKTFETPIQDAQEYINAFCQMEGQLTRRGLERSLSRQHGEERSYLKEKARQSVLIYQQRLKHQGLKGDELSDHISTMYQDAARPAKIFARRLGKGDEYVAVHGEDNTSAQSILDQLEQQKVHQKRERRLSNFSSMSANSFDSRRRWGSGGAASALKAKCPASPVAPMEEYYAAIA